MSGFGTYSARERDLERVACSACGRAALAWRNPHTGHEILLELGSGEPDPRSTGAKRYSSHALRCPFSGPWHRAGGAVTTDQRIDR